MHILRHPKGKYIVKVSHGSFFLNIPAFSQHYGYPTELIALTSNFEVTSFIEIL